MKGERGDKRLFIFFWNYLQADPIEDQNISLDYSIEDDHNFGTQILRNRVRLPPSRRAVPQIRSIAEAIFQCILLLMRQLWHDC